MVGAARPWYRVRMTSRQHDRRNPVLLGLVAGSAGTVALNVAAYCDMAVRGRAGSSVPARAAARIAQQAGVPLGRTGSATHRKTALGQLLGYAASLGVGMLYGTFANRRALPVPAAALGVALAAMFSTDAAHTLLGVTDPRRWSAKDWVADILPHLAYGAATAATFDVVAD